MAGDKHIDIQQVAKAVEDKHGCSILDAFHGQSLDEQLSAMRQLNAMHLRHVSVDVEADNLHGWDPDPIGGGHLYMTVQESGLLGRTLFKEDVRPVSGLKIYHCTDLDKNGNRTDKKVKE